MDTIPKQAAAQQEIKIRKTFAIKLIACGICIGLTAVFSIFGFGLQAAFLSILLVIIFYANNTAEMNILVSKYE